MRSMSKRYQICERCENTMRGNFVLFQKVALPPKSSRRLQTL